MKRTILAIFFTAAASLAHAQEFKITSLDCAGGVYGHMGAFGQPGMIVYAKIPDSRPLANGEFRTKLLDAIFKDTMARCRGKRRVAIALSYINVPDGFAFLAGKTAANLTWQILEDKIADRIAKQDEKERKDKAKEDARIAADNVRQNFAASNGVVAYITIRQLKANPFAFRNKVVGIFGRFTKMISPQEAIFETYVLQSVPAEKFTMPGQSVVIAMKPTGTRMMPTFIGQTEAPVGQYINHYVCERNGCSDFYNDK